MEVFQGTMKGQKREILGYFTVFYAKIAKFGLLFKLLLSSGLTHYLRLTLWGKV